MMNENSIIADSEDIVNADYRDPDDECADLEATAQPTGDKMEFHVQMRGYTMTDMETLIVEAAARQLLRSRSAGSEKQIEKVIQEAVAAMIQKQVSAALERVTADILSQPMISGKEPVTVKQFIEMSWRDWLSNRVDLDGKDYTGYGGSALTRAEWFIWKGVEQKFNNAVTAATNAAISEMQKAVSAEQAKIIAAEKKRLAEALAKITA